MSPLVLTSGVLTPFPSLFPEPAEGYRPLEALQAELVSLARAHPDRVTVEEIGRTVLGQPILAFHVEPTGELEERVLVLGGVHALEWIAVETADRFLRDLVIAPPAHARVTVLPALNVDGRLASEASLRAGDNVYFRGNGSDPPTDLNRDFAVHHEPKGVWSRLLPAYAASTPEPLSQPESRALDALAARERFDRAASLHSFGGYLYYPWAGTWERPEDWREFAELGRAMEAAQGPRAYRPRQLSRWGFFFRAHGTEIDHLYGRYGTRAFLIELTRSGARPLHPLDSWRTYFRWYNPTDPERHVERGVDALRALVAGGP